MARLVRSTSAPGAIDRERPSTVAARAVLLVANLVLLLATGVAHAAGRAPMTTGVAFQPGDPHSLYVRSSFGLLVSHDDGCSFRWVCEQAIGYDAGAFDPKYAVAADGTIFATTFKGLRVSRDGGCTWSLATPEMWVDAIEIGPTGEVWIATAETASPSDVFRSRDTGRTWERRGMWSPHVWWKSVLVAKGDARRVYVTGYQVAGPPLADGAAQMPEAHFLRSDDGGDTWTEEPLTGLAFNATPIVLARALDPADGDVVMMTSLGANGRGDVLYRSSDAGASWTEVLRTDENIRDVVLHDGRVLAVTQSRGSFESRDGGKTFAPIAAPQLACLGSHDGALVGCAANWEPDNMAVAIARDGAHWNRVFRFGDLAGTLACPAGSTSASKCDPQWPATRAQFAAVAPSCPAPPPRPAPVVAAPRSGGCCDAGAPSSGLAALVVGFALRRRRR